MKEKAASVLQTRGFATRAVSLGKTPPALSRFGAAFGSLAAGPKKGLHPMRINKVAFIGKGGVGLLYGSMIARALGDDAVEFVMDDARYERHAADQLKINGEPSNLRSVRASEATPADLVILTIKTTGLNQALDTMEAVVGPETRIASLCNGITSEQKIAERFGSAHGARHLPGHGCGVPE